ncbi:MAG: ATP-dependent sacrificial sulfur transferase LarE [Candidatus Heteroscillospira sp.]|jgi:uncharacterized protein
MTLQNFFEENTRCALAFSGGVDSAYLLWFAKSCGADVKAYYAHTPFQPGFELEDARRMAAETGAEMRLVELDPLEDARIACNDERRCYWCKRAIFSAIQRAAESDGYSLIIDGTNASDDAEDRPGMQALREMGVRSPLRECGVTKAMVRENSRRAGLFTADKPAYACLATRIPTGETITVADLNRVEQAEKAMSALGFSDFRVRKRGEAALLQITEEQRSMALEKSGLIREKLRPWFVRVWLDMEARQASR